jgi:multiple sugar transport system substrate-binding protein
VRDFDYKAWDNLAGIFDGWGAEAWSADGKTCGFNQQPMVDAMTFIHKAIFTDKAMPGPGVAADFFAGESAMTITQISRASLLKDAKFKWTLVPLPAGPKGEYSVIGQGGLGVLKKSRNADAAADFLTFFTNEANSAKLAQFFPPPRQSQLTADTLGKSNPLLKPEQLQDVVIDGIANGVVKPSHRDSAEISQAVRSALDPLWKADAQVKPVLDGVCTAIQPLLAP